MNLLNLFHPPSSARYDIWGRRMTKMQNSPGFAKAGGKSLNTCKPCPIWSLRGITSLCSYTDLYSLIAIDQVRERTLLALSGMGKRHVPISYIPCKVILPSLQGKSESVDWVPAPLLPLPRNIGLGSKNKHSLQPVLVERH